MEAETGSSYYTVNDRLYFYVEPTREDYSMGQIQTEFDERNAYVYPLKS
jgi:hypothetical protein